MKTIRVVHLTIGLQWGGSEKLMADIVRRLDKDRFGAQVVALQGDGPVGRQLREAGVPVTTLNTTGRWDVRAYGRLNRFLEKEEPDLVHAHLLRANLLACLTRRRHAVVWHDHCGADWLNPPLRFLEKRLIVRSDAVIVVSEAVRQELLVRCPEIASRLAVLPNAIDTRWPPPGEKPALRRDLWGLRADQLVVGYVGRLDRFKGISYLLRSAALLKTSLPSLRLILVGEGRDRHTLERLCRRLGIEDAVIFAGPRSDVQKMYSSFDVLALPSLSEGFGIVLLEAMAAALPVVASRVGGIPEVVRDQETGLLVPPADPMALAQALEQLLRDPDKRKRMGLKGLERVRAEFDLDQVIPKLEGIYRDVLTGGDRS